jgi:D-serine deaminase-like pyridoxal phosphate-dependent protein
MRVEDLDTPVPTVDLDAVERNVMRAQAWCDARGLALRPHVKTHKLPGLAHVQIRAGAVGIACQKLGEAEVMAAAGLADILVTYPIVGARKTARFAALAREVSMAAAGDSEVVARGLSAALEAAGAEAAFLVDCDTGFGRTGVQSPQDAVALARVADELPGLRFAGFATYPTLPGTGAWLGAAVELAEAAGLSPEWVSGGGTPADRLRAAEAAPALTEVRMGTYIYGDRACMMDGSVPLTECALRVRTTVVSRPTGARAILDAGSKALTSDGAPGVESYGYVVEYPEATIVQLNEEHAYVDLSACDEVPAVGEVVTVVPNHACGVTNLHDEVVAHRAGDVVAVWPVVARGRLR